MSTRLPMLDLHTHIDAQIAAAELTQLPGIAFAASRTLAESDTALQRRDPRVVWGAGCHPGLARNHSTFDAAAFEQLVGKTAYVSEIGLDGSSKIGIDRQLATFNSILAILQRQPRITSIHSHRAHDEILAALAERPIRGAVLHWWLGTPAQTKIAVELGCYFSLNTSSIKRLGSIGAIPRERILTETDHPFGDRTSAPPRMPSNTASAEQGLAAHYNTTPAELRAVLWRNLGRLITETRCSNLMSRAVFSHVIVAG